MAKCQIFNIRYPKSSSQGFTIIELLLVVAIFFAVAGFAPAFYNRFFLQDAVVEAADRIAGSLRNAQGFSLAGKGSLPWGVALNGNAVVLFQGNSFATRNTALDRQIALPSSVSISGLSETVFARVSGMPTAPLTISLTASGGVSRSVLMNSLGVVSRE
ncbi:MAG: prepilin-type N-terminal cleavage/methylation domain-containing protein [Candidatus Moraniibacteriota bacterium]|nr:MAG: prepilin-type N-terminal cleavage/methylation domain-containing protein [Candidatus Moranbacteria bacterium]